MRTDGRARLVRVLLLPCGLAALLGYACSEAPSGPGGASVDEPSIPALIVSEVSNRSVGASSGVGADGVTYVSLPPGTLPGGLSVVIRNVTAGDGALSPLRLTEGGFDPVAVPASVGDRLELAFTDRAGLVTYAYSTVPARRPPTIVRTSPTSGRTDVPLDVRPRTTFSEPVDPTTLPDGIRLVSGGLPVAGRVESPIDEPWAVEFVPDAALHPSSSYTLEITTGVRDLEGDGLDAALLVTFTTSAQAPPPEPPVATIPDDAKIAFARREGRGTHIHVARRDGSGETRIARGEFPTWSPDGRELAYVSGRSIHVLSAGIATTLWETGSPWGPWDLEWSPDGASIAFMTLDSGSAAIATIGRADGRVAYLTGDTPGVEMQPTWSPDSRRLAFVSDREAYDFMYDIYTMNADGSGQQLRTKGFHFWPDTPWYLHPAWSPDGSVIAFVYGTVLNGSYETQYDSDMRFHVAVMSPDGTFLKDLAWAGDIPWDELLDPGALAWSPDGAGIAYTFFDCDLTGRSGCTKSRSVRYVSLDGTVQRTIATYGSDPSWRP